MIDLWKNRKRKTLDSVFSVVTTNIARGASVLELSCGRGHLAASLAKAGYDVLATNYSDYEDAVDAVEIINGVDITKAPVFTDKLFDCVILSETMQNIADHSSTYKTMSALLKDGGYAIISTPNIMSIKSRLHFFFTGFFKVKWNFISDDVPLDESFCYHNHPVHLPVTLYYAGCHNLHISYLSGIKCKFKSLLLFFVFFLPIYVATIINILCKEPFLSKSAEAKKLVRLMTCFETLSSERLLLVFRKCSREERPRSTPRISWHRKLGSEGVLFR